MGRLLIEGAKEVKLFGETVVVKAEIHNLEGFSGHADQKGLFEWISSFEKKPKQVFLVHGETDSKKDFAKLIETELGYDPVVIMQNSEFELETGRLLSKEEVITEVMDDEGIEELKDKIVNVKEQLDQMLSGAEDAMKNQLSAEKLQQINNIVLELEKASLNLGSSLTSENRDTTPLSEQGDM